MEKKLRDIQQQYNKMTQQQKIKKVKQYAESLGLPYNFDWTDYPEDAFWSSIPIQVQKDSIKQFYIRKSWYQKYNEQLGFDWFLQEFPFKYPGIETKQQLDAYLEDKVLQIRKKIAKGERAETHQQRQARHQADQDNWKMRQAQYKMLDTQKKFILFEVTKQQAEYYFNQYTPMISEYRFVKDTEILPGINKYKAIKYTLLTHQTGIPQVNMSLCDIYLNVIQD